MTSSIDTQTSNSIAQKIEESMGITDLTPNSKIKILVNGLLNENVIGKTFTENTLNNFYIQTAEEKYLELAGVSENLPRIKEQYLRIENHEESVSLRKVENNSPYTKTIEKGTTFEILENELWLTFNEELNLDGATNSEIFFNCDLKVNTNNSSFSIGKDTYYILKINNEDYYLTFNDSISIPVITEDIDTYRSRLIYAKNSPRYGTISAIRLAIASIPFITSFIIKDQDIVIFNRSLLNSDEDYDLLNNSGIPLSNSLIHKVKGEGISYTVTLPKKINISIILKANKNNPREVPFEWFSFKDYLLKEYVFGSLFIISLKQIEDYFKSLGIDLSFLKDYDLVFYKNFLGESYKSSITTIQIEDKEYPYINEVNVE